MARGSQAKAEITQKILETFENSFIYDKEVRIPVMENGELVQIKCVLTCAKVNVECGSDTAIPNNTITNNEIIAELTEQEKKETADLLASLNL